MMLEYRQFQFRYNIELGETRENKHFLLVFKKRW